MQIDFLVLVLPKNVHFHVVIPENNSLVLSTLYPYGFWWCVD